MQNIQSYLKYLFNRMSIQFGPNLAWHDRRYQLCVCFQLSYARDFTAKVINNAVQIDKARTATQISVWSLGVYGK